MLILRVFLINLLIIFYERRHIWRYLLKNNYDFNVDVSIYFYLIPSKDILDNFERENYEKY